MTIDQQNFLESLEITLAGLVHGGYSKEAEVLAPIVDLVDKEEFVIAYLEAEASGMDARFLNRLKEVYDVRWT